MGSMHDERTDTLAQSSETGLPGSSPQTNKEWNLSPMNLREKQNADSERLLHRMRASGVPVTRQHYIELAWGASVPATWTADHEELLPIDLQDWTKCEPDEQPGD